MKWYVVITHVSDFDATWIPAGPIPAKRNVKIMYSVLVRASSDFLHYCSCVVQRTLGMKLTPSKASEVMKEAFPFSSMAMPCPSP